MSDLSPQTMELIINYAYSDSLPVTEKNMVPLLIAADRLNIMGLIQVCRDMLMQHLSPLNCIKTWKFADEYSQLELKYKAFLFMLTCFEEVVTTSNEFKDVSVEELVEILENDRINVKEERIVYEAILYWINSAPEERQQHLSHLLSKVRLAQISEEYIRHRILENPMVNNSSMCKKILHDALEVIRHLRSNPSSNTHFLNPVASPRLPSATLLAFGGKANSVLHSATNTIQAYDSRADRWVNVTSNNVAPRAFHKSVFLNGFVYCVGGNDNMQRLSSVHRFDPKTHAWQEVAPMHSRRSYVTVTVLDGHIYALGGYDGCNRLATAEVYWPETNQWTEITPMHQERSNAGCVALNGKVYVFGGFNGLRCLSSSECYDPHTNQWTMIANMERDRAGLGVVAYANKIYAVGGLYGHMDSVEAYDPNSNTWHSQAPMLKSRCHFGISVMDGCIFVVGGYNDSGAISTVECYDFETAQWSNVCDLDVRLAALSCCVVHGLQNMRDYAFPRYSSH